jgi:hypothetical protein
LLSLCVGWCRLVAARSPPVHRLSVELVASGQLAHELDGLRKLGADADGEAGEPHPVRAISEVLAKRPADEIILATSRHLLARMMAMDLPHRVQRHFGLPVTVLGVGRKNKA